MDATVALCLRCIRHLIRDVDKSHLFQATSTNHCASDKNVFSKRSNFLKNIMILKTKNSNQHPDVDYND